MKPGVQFRTRNLSIEATIPHKYAPPHPARTSTGIALATEPMVDGKPRDSFATLAAAIESGSATSPQRTRGITCCVQLGSICAAKSCADPYSSLYAFK